jgi:hypothetical protein
MGLEAECTARFGGKEGVGKAHLDTAKLDFRGAFKLSIPFAEMKEVEAKRGVLRIRFPKGELALELGKAAEAWCLKIRYPKGRLDKLGVKPGQRLALVAFDDDAFADELRARTDDVTIGKPRKDCDAIFFGAKAKKDLARLASFEASLKRNGALWVIRPKGVKEITERDVYEAGKAAGYVDVKVVSFSETHTAEKFVIPVARR